MAPDVIKSLSPVIPGRDCTRTAANLTRIPKTPQGTATAAAVLGRQIWAVIINTACVFGAKWCLRRQRGGMRVLVYLRVA